MLISIRKFKFILKIGKEGEHFMKSIKNKILVVMLAIGVFISIVLGVIGTNLNSKSTNSTLEKTLSETAAIAAMRVESELQTYKCIISEMGCISNLSNPELPEEVRALIAGERVERYGLAAAGLIGLDGKDIATGIDCSNEEFFKSAVSGSIYCSDFMTETVFGINNAVVFSGPVWNGGRAGNEIAGVVYVVPSTEFLNNIMRDIVVGDGGTAYLLSSSGMTMAYPDASIVGVENAQELVKTDASYKGLAEVEARMIAGETGFDRYNYNGQMELVSYAPVKNTNGWSIGVNVVEEEFLSELYESININIIVIIIAIIASIVISTLFAKRISAPIVACTERIKRLAEGDLSSPVEKCNTEDETKILNDATHEVINDINNIISDLERVLGEISEGNLMVDTKKNENYYVGDYKQLLEYAVNIKSNLAQTMEQINIAGSQVSIGADQIANGAQMLSQGATEQASSVEQLAATFNVVSAKIDENARATEQATNKTDITVLEMQNANERMNELVDAMNSISGYSEKIQLIIKTIEDIAFQTNILALNAAVEAARAGEVGKGFAVVADEVRNLASKSAEAAQNTTSLIESTVTAVRGGTELVKDVAEKMETVLSASNEVADINKKISEVSAEAASSIEQITTGVDQISKVVQTNSATAEQSAAASEELSGQARMLDELIRKFKYSV